MLGRYDLFPTLIHGEAELESPSDTKTLQSSLISTLHLLNRRRVKIKEVVRFEKEDIEVSFEFGLADGNVFTFIDESEVTSFLEALETVEIRVMDIFCVLKYHRTSGGRRVPLKFDRGFLRFSFEEGGIKVLFHFEKGTRRLPFSALITFFLKVTNRILRKAGGEKVRLVEVREV